MSFQPVLDSLNKILTDILDFIPHFINGLIILIVGYLICLLIRWILRRVLRSIRLDQLLERSGITATVQSLGVRVPISEILVQIVFFFLFLGFATSAASLMGLAAVAELLNNVLRFVPRAISAALLLILGSMVARFLGNTVASVAENVNISYGKALGKILEYAIVTFAAVLAIATLGVDTTVLSTSLTIIVASAGLAVALTFGLGAREAARHVIAARYVRQTFTPGQRLTYGNYSGRVRVTNGAYTILEDVSSQPTSTGQPISGGNPQTVSIPNALLMETAIVGEEENPANDTATENITGSPNPPLN